MRKQDSLCLVEDQVKVKMNIHERFINLFNIKSLFKLFNCSTLRLHLLISLTYAATVAKGFGKGDFDLFAYARKHSFENYGFLLLL